MHAHPRHPATEARPTAVAAQRSTDGGSPRLHTRDARPLVQFVVLDGVDLVDEVPLWPPRSGVLGMPVARSINATPAPSTPGMAWAANSATSPQQVDHARGRRPPSRPLRCSPACNSTSSASRWAGDDFGLLARFATGLGVEVGNIAPHVHA